MSSGLPVWAALCVAFFLVVGSGLTLIGAMGAVRLKSFYERVHAPTLGTTGGIGGVLIASMIFFSVTGEQLVLREVLIAAFVIVTTPVTLMLLVRAALYRDRSEGTVNAPGFEELSGQERGGTDRQSG